MEFDLTSDNATALLASTMDWNPPVDPIICLASQLTQLGLSPSEELEKQAREVLAANNTILSAYPHTVSAVGAFLRLHIGGGQLRKVEKTDQTTRRIKVIIALLTREENRKLENSYILVAIIKEMLRWLYVDNAELARDFEQKIISDWAVDTYMRLWKEALDFWIEVELSLPGSDVKLEQLRFFSALVADLYSEQLIQWEQFEKSTRYALDIISGPVLFNLFLYDFMARGLTGSGAKSPESTWALIVEKWMLLQSTCGRDDVTGAVVSLFYQDARRTGRCEAYCAIKWPRTPSISGDTACWNIIHELVLGTLKDEAEVEKMARADSELVGAMEKVQLECEMDGLAESFGRFR